MVYRLHSHLHALCVYNNALTVNSDVYCKAVFLFLMLEGVEIHLLSHFNLITLSNLLLHVRVCVCASACMAALIN